MQANVLLFLVSKKDKQSQQNIGFIYSLVGCISKGRKLFDCFPIPRLKRKKKRPLERNFNTNSRSESFYVPNNRYRISRFMVRDIDRCPFPFPGSFV